MKIVLVHGRAQEGKNPVALKKLWVDTLKIGLAKSGLVLPIEDNDIIFPFYGDKLDELARAFNQPLEEIIKKGGPFLAKHSLFLHDFLMEIAENANISIAEIQSNFSENIVEKGPLNWAWVQAILRAIDRKEGWSELAIKKFTYDVFLYLTIHGVRNSINEIVINSIPDEPFIIVGHSLGTIVTYNILRDNNNLKVARYVTIGSPLGLDAVKKYLKTPILMPQCTKGKWLNAFDKRDVVALNPLDKLHFDVDPPVVNKNDVDNQTGNRHGIEGYLNDKVIAGEIYSALSH